MYSIKVDPHTHTIFSGHAFSTIEENARRAAEIGLEAIAMTDHFGPLFNDKPGGAAMNMGALPKTIYGVRILAGAEIDIVDLQGTLAFQDVMMGDQTACHKMIESRDFSIASVHIFPGYKDGTMSQNTQMYSNVLQTPGIDMLGHIGRAGLPFDIPELVSVAKETGKIIEINEHSQDFGEPINSVCRKIAETCAEQGVTIAVSSDAHSSFFIGEFTRVLQMLEEIHFPEELIVNTSYEKFTAFTAKNRIG